MAGPITWRNVNATVRGSDGGRGSGYFGAQKSFDSGFEALNKVIQARQDTNKANFQNRQNNMAADYLDQVAQARNLEDVNALRESDALAQLRGSLTGAARDKIRGALDQRETVLIEQIGQRQSFEDEQFNRELRPEVQSLFADAYAGDAGALRRLNELGYRGDGNKLGELYKAYTASQDEQRAKNTDARAWNADARAQGDFENRDRLADREWGKLLEGDALDEATANFFLRMGQQDTDMTATEIRNKFTQELLKDGYSLDQAQGAAASLDDARVSRLTMAGEDAAALQAQEQQLASDMGMANNPVYQSGGFSQDPLKDANEILSEFKDEDGLLFGESDPEERGAFVSDAQTALGSGIRIDGKVRRIPPEVLRGAVQAVPGSYWLPDRGNSIADAIAKYTAENKEILEYIDKYNEFEQARQDLQSTVSTEVKPQSGRTRLSIMDLTGGN